ncbi:MAG TPA: DUF559 domain-containing protein [Pseudonocardia sp.]
MALPIPGLHGAHRRTDLIELLGRRRLGAALRSGEVVPLWTGTVVEVGRLLDPLTRSAAAQLTAGPRAALYGVTAAQLHGCASVASPETHVVVPYGRDIQSRAGLVVHHGRAIPEDVQMVDGLRVLALDRVIADLLCLLPCRGRAQDALAVLDQALRQAGDGHDTFRKAVADRLDKRPDIRGTVLARGLLDLGSGRAESPAESWLRLKLIDNGVPLPEVNWVITTPDGREIVRLDLAWPSMRVCIEYDGWETHAGRKAADEARAAELRKHGWIVIRVDVAALRSVHGLVVELRAAFAKRGYTW